MAKVALYRGRDPRDVPTYGIREAASYMRLPPTTLREWVTGAASVISLAGSCPPLLSFWNLVEAYVRSMAGDRVELGACAPRTSQVAPADVALPVERRVSGSGMPMDRRLPARASTSGTSKRVLVGDASDPRRWAVRLGPHDVARPGVGRDLRAVITALDDDELATVWSDDTQLGLDLRGARPRRR